MNTQISIIGCGWLGFPLAQHLINNGYSIKGSTTSKAKRKALRKASIIPFTICLNEKGITGDIAEFLSESQTLIINIPPDLRKDALKNHVTEIRHLVSAIEISKIKNVIYVSSTSVFKDEIDFPVIREDSDTNATSMSGQQLIAIEQMLKNNSKFNTTVLRFGGLFDENRHPAKYLSGRKNISNPDAPVNLIHKTDCIDIISKLIEGNHYSLTLNAVTPHHPTKKSYYTHYCKKKKLPLPAFKTSGISKGKLVESNKLVQLLNYTFQHAL